MLKYKNELASVGEVYFFIPLKEMTKGERERVADCLSTIAADILKHEATAQHYLMSIYQEVRP